MEAITQPKNLNTNLYQHQLINIYRMEQFELTNIAQKTNDTVIYTKLGINADPTGYGKTLAMIGLIVRDQMKWELNEPVENITQLYACNLIKHVSTSNLEKIQTNLILVPKSIIGQWKKEFEHTSLKVKCIAGKRDVKDLNVKQYDVIIVVPSQYNQLVFNNEKYIWKRFIFDEPSQIYVPSMRKVQAGFIWLVTATPNEIIRLHNQRRDSFIRGLFDLDRWTHNINRFSPIIIKNSLEFVQKSFTMPKTHHKYYKCYQPILRTVRNVISGNIKRLIEAGDIEQALSLLGGKKTDNIVELLKKRKLEELNEINARIHVHTLNNNEQLEKEWNERKKRVELQLQELEEKFTKRLQGTCSICLSQLDNPVLEPNCQNIFCGECLLSWLQTKSSCPLCRNTVHSNDLVCIKQNDKEKKIEHKPKIRKLTKIEQVIDIINNKKNGKFIIFSSSDQTFVPAQNVLTDQNIVFKELKGRKETIEKIIDSYKTGDTQVIFLNSKHYGAGLNLQETTDIIIYHEMGDDMQTQIIGRANRIGRKEELYVHHLL